VGKETTKTINEGKEPVQPSAALGVIIQVAILSTCSIPSHGIKAKESHEDEQNKPTTKATQNSASVEAW
jgi:hypothetical protein